MKFHHIGVACQDINLALKNIKKYFTIKNIGEIIFDDKQDASLCMIETEEEPLIELISGEVVKNIIKKGINYYHLCYSVKNMGESLEEFRSKGAIIISPPKPAILFKGKKVAFLHLGFGMIELLEE